jgi:hypothetical protein
MVNLFHEEFWLRLEAYSSELPDKFYESIITTKSRRLKVKGF